MSARAVSVKTDSANGGSAKIALVTGAAKRVGRAIALELASAGCDIAIHYHTSEAEAEDTASLIRKMSRRCHLVQADLATESSWQHIVTETVSAMGGLSILINNASIFEATLEDRFDLAAWDRMFRVNLTSAIAISQAASVHLREAVDGNIVNLTDISADRPWPEHVAYCASKAALVNATKSMARAFSPDVRVNAVSPGIAIFPDRYDEATREKLVARVPLNREGTPEEVAKAVRYLTLEAGYVTGQILSVDGGRSIA